MIYKLFKILCFKAAQQISTVAMHLDHLKNTPMLGKMLRGILAQFVERLHDAANYLAGDRADEIYSSDEAIVMLMQKIRKGYGIDRPLLSVVIAAGINEVSEDSHA